MPNRPFKPLTIPLGKGTDQSRAHNLAASEVTLLSSLNVDFGLIGGLIGRPGTQRATGFSARALGPTGFFSDATVAGLAASGYTNPTGIVVRDGRAERAGIVTTGRMFTYDGSRWTDRLGATQASVSRVSNIREVGSPAGTVTNDAYLAGVSTYDMGASENATATVGFTPAQTLALFAANGSVESRVQLANVLGAGNGAAHGTTTAFVHVPHGTNNLVFVSRAAGAHTVTEVILAADAQDPAGTGDAPCICCDYNEGSFFVAYWTTVAGTYKALKVSNTGTIAATHTHATGVTPRGIWITNGATATGKTVIAYTGTGILGALTRVLTTSTWANAAIDLAMSGGPATINSGQIVCGAAESGEVWVSWVNDPGEWHVAKRSLTAATQIWNRFWQGKAPSTLGGPGSANKEGGTFFIQHQPIKVGARVLMGLSMVRNSGISFSLAAATWLVYDITDLWTNAGTNNYKLRDPVTVAKGTSYGSMVAWGPAAAVVFDAKTYRFPTVEWLVTRYPGQAGALDATTDVGGGTLVGERGMLGLNEIILTGFQSAAFKQSTIVAGSVPRLMSRGSTHPCGFPWLEAPTIQVGQIAGGGGTVPVGSYTVQALWSWMDDAGQVHRSEPSFPVTINFTLQRLQVTIGAPHLNERETGLVYVELYISEVNPTAGAPLTFRRRYAYPGTGTATVTEIFLTIPVGGIPIYTAGNVLENQIPDASGGIATVGPRCWVASKDTVYASKLGDLSNNEAPAWHIDGTLTLATPTVAGSIVGLAPLGDKLIVFCERGILVTQGEGPDDVGQGPAFAQLTKVNDLGCVDQRSIAAAEANGIFFQSANYLADQRITTGGMYALDAGFNVKLLSKKIQLDAAESSLAGEVVWSPEREQVYWFRAGQIMVFDLRAQEWTTWQQASGAATFGTTGVVAAGVLWSIGVEPAQFIGTDGNDVDATAHPFDMFAQVGNINIAEGPLRWGRVRSMGVVGDSSGVYTLTQTITLDDYATSTSVPTVIAGGVATWPTSRLNTEWRVPAQKCSTVSCSLNANPGVAVWTAIELQVYSNGGRAPSNYRQ